MENQIHDTFKFCVKNNIKLPRSFYLDDEVTLKDLDQIDKDKVIIEFLKIIRRYNMRNKKLEDPYFFENFLNYFDIKIDNTKVLRSIFTYIIDIKSTNFFDIFFSRYQDYVADNILYFCDRTLTLISPNVDFIKILVEKCSDDNYIKIKEGIMCSINKLNRIVREKVKYNFVRKNTSNDYNNKKSIYDNDIYGYLTILTRLVLIKGKIIDLNYFLNSEINEISLFLRTVLSFENFKKIKHVDIFIYTKDTIEYFLSGKKIKNCIIVKNLLYLGCDISNMNIKINNKDNYFYRFLGDPSNTYNCMIVDKKINFNDFYDLLKLNKNNISPELYGVWNNFWMNKAIKDFRNENLDSIIWKDFIENKENISYKEHYDFLEEHLYYRPNGKGYKEALCSFNSLN